MKMNSKIIVVTIALIGISSILFAQDSKYQRLALFDRANFIERLRELNISNMDTLEIIQGEAVVKDEKTNKQAMRWFKVNEDDMAAMHNMGIRKDVHYKMNIKKYESYQKIDELLKQNSPEENKELLKPLKKKKG